jgi:hypothetical protein
MTFIDTAAIASDGSYQFTNVSPDEYLVLADADTLQYPYAVRTYFGDSIYWAKATVLKVASDTSVSISITEVFPTFGPGRINGVVISGPNSKKKMGPGSPVKGVKLSLNSKSTSAAIQITESGDSGKFTFTNIPVGDYFVYADTTGIPVDLSLPSTVFSIDSTDTLFKDVYIYIDSNKVYIIDSSGVSVPGLTYGKLITIGNIYPVPSGGEFFLPVESESEQTLILSLCDIRGQLLLKEETIALPRGKSVITFDGRGLAAGFYLLGIKASDGTFISLLRIAVTK